MSRLLRETFDLREGSSRTILQTLLHACRLHLGMEVAFISEFENGRRVFRFVDEVEGVALLEVGSGDPVDESYCRKVVDGRLPELIHNAQELEEARALPATEELGIGAHLSTPIRLRDGSIFGTLCSFSFRPDYTLNERDLALLRVFADLAAGVMEKDFDAAREKEAKRRRIEELLESDRLTAVWQPIVEVTSGRLAGVESLARFPREPHPGPAEWFEEAATVGLAAPLEAKAVEKGLEILRHLPADRFVACNATAAAILGGGVLDRIEDMPLERIILEITEHDVIGDYASLSEALAPLRGKGLRLAVDDAGAGYASFRHILKLRPDLIKLDLSLTRDIDSDIGRRSLTVSLVQFSREIGSGLVAEGVETQAELDTLAALGVGMAQGYFLHRPKPLDELLTLLRG